MGEEGCEGCCLVGRGAAPRRLGQVEGIKGPVGRAMDLGLRSMLQKKSTTGYFSNIFYKKTEFH